LRLTDDFVVSVISNGDNNEEALLVSLVFARCYFVLWFCRHQNFRGNLQRPGHLRWYREAKHRHIHSCGTLPCKSWASPDYLDENGYYNLVLAKWLNPATISMEISMNNRYYFDGSARLIGTARR